MANQPSSSGSKRRRRDRGDGTIAWDKASNCYVGNAVARLQRRRQGAEPSQRTDKAKAEAKDNLDKLRDEINAGVRTPATYTIEQCVKDWFDSIERDPHTMESIVGQAKNWVYPKIGKTKLEDFTATDAGQVLQGTRGSDRQAVIGDDQEHPSPLYPPSPGWRGALMRPSSSWRRSPLVWSGCLAPIIPPP
jgi:hypothetical protein